VGKILGRKFSDYFDFFYSSFGNPTGADPKAPVPRAQAINTLDEAMDSAWWQRRHYYRPMTIEELVRGPGGDRPPSPTGKWTVTSSKNEGVTPGFTIVDETGEKYALKFDPIGHPEMASAPDVLVGRFFHALGYNVPDNYIVELDPDRLEIRKGAKVKDELGKEREMNPRDITEILIKVPRDAQGRYRALASRYIKRRLGGAVPLLGHAPRRPERHRPPRAPARPARLQRGLRLARPRRFALGQHH
jgi:hypothetical protein